MINLLKILLLSHFIFCIFCQFQNPPQVSYEPLCSLAGQLTGFYISVHETQIINMDNFFKGYNLNVTLEKLPSFATASQKVSKKEHISSNLHNMRQVNIQRD